jgi:hypothetical protein
MPELIDLIEAAKLLGYTPSGLRKIIERSREAAKGRRVNGPTIRFFQSSKWAPIKFRREWIDEFIAAGTVEPKPAEAPAAKLRRPLIDGREFGFDPKLLRLR